jgi:catechol 2,3-dioxygenase-like lactoylglutathione lyase family enzyme
MIDHVSTYTTRFDQARAFYLAALGALGYGVQAEMTASWDPVFPTRRCVAFGPAGKPVLWVVETREEATPRHIAFAAADRAGVDAFYAAGLANGGSDNGTPGVREVYHPGYYGGFLLDPDGNNVEAVNHWGPGV